MARFLLQTHPTTATILDRALLTIEADPTGGWCIVAPRTAMTRDLRRRLQTLAAGKAGWVGARIMTVEELVEHYAAEELRFKALNSIQMRQLIAQGVLAVHAANPHGPFAANVSDGRVADGTLHSLSRLFLELEPHDLSADEMLKKLTDDRPAPSARAQAITEVYRLYQQATERHGVKGRLGRALAAAQAASGTRPPTGVRKFFFLGLDASGPNDIAFRLVNALRENRTHVDAVALALVYPDDRTAMGWSAHGNDLTMDAWREQTDAIPQPSDLSAVPLLRSLPPDLAAMVEDPFAFRLGSVPSTGAVRMVRVPDMQVELEWVAGDIKRRLSADPTLKEDDIAIVARDMSDREPDLRRALALVGLTLVTSHEERAVAVPPVRAILTLFRIAAFNWRSTDLIAAAESPYLNLGLAPGLIAELAEQGTIPSGAADWIARAEATARRIADEAPEGLDPSLARLVSSYSDLATALRRLDAKLAEVIGPAVGQTPAAWVHATQDAVERWGIDEQIYTATDVADLDLRGELTRRDIDGVSVFTEGARDWYVGRQYADTAAALVDATEWYRELEAVAEVASMRSSSYAHMGVLLCDPVQAGLRNWRLVYMIGLVDGVWPRAAQYDEHALDDTERAALKLPTHTQRAAKEGLLFHLAAGAAREALTLVSPSADARGRALATSPFLHSLALRIDGLKFEPATARELIPASPADVVREGDLDLVAAALYRRVADEVSARADLDPAARAALLRERVSADPILGPWESTRAGRAVQRTWGVQRLRADARVGVTGGEDLTAEERSYLGIVPALPQGVALGAQTTTWTPSDIEMLDGCRYRYFATRVLGLRKGLDEDHDEAAAFGTLQHRVLERLYRELYDDGHLPPTHQDSLTHALARVEAIADEEVTAYVADARDILYTVDFAALRDTLRAYVARDLREWLARQTQDTMPALRTTLLGLEVEMGRSHPIEIPSPSGVPIRLRSRLDRLELIDDLRLTGKQANLNGWLRYLDYKSSRKSWGPRPKDYMEGKHLALPLGAYIAEQHVRATMPDLANVKVFSAAEVKTSINVTPEPLQRRQVTGVRRDGVMAFEFPKDGRAESGDVLETAMTAATERSAALVEEARQGLFAPQPGRRCYGCPLSDVCRASLAKDTAQQSRRRAPMPLALTSAEYAAAGGVLPDAPLAEHADG